MLIWCLCSEVFFVVNNYLNIYGNDSKASLHNLLKLRHNVVFLRNYRAHYACSAKKHKNSLDCLPYAEGWLMDGLIVKPNILFYQGAVLSNSEALASELIENGKNVSWCFVLPILLDCQTMTLDCQTMTLDCQTMTTSRSFITIPYSIWIYCIVTTCLLIIYIYIYNNSSYTVFIFHYFYNLIYMKNMILKYDLPWLILLYHQVSLFSRRNTWEYYLSAKIFLLWKISLC